MNFLTHAIVYLLISFGAQAQSPTRQAPESATQLRERMIAESDRQYSRILSILALNLSEARNSIGIQQRANSPISCDTINIMNLKRTNEQAYEQIRLSWISDQGKSSRMRRYNYELFLFIEELSVIGCTLKARELSVHFLDVANDVNFRDSLFFFTEILSEIRHRELQAELRSLRQSSQ